MILSAAEPHASESLVQFFKFLEPYKRPGLLTANEGNAISLHLIEVMADGRVDHDLLKFTSRFFTPEDYREVVTERNILHLCGYPLCDADPKGTKKEHQINYRQHNPALMILPASYLNQYCSRQHYQSSLFFEKQLSELSVFTRKDVTYKPYGTMDYELQTVLLEEVQEISTQQNRPMESIIADFKALSVNPSETPIENTEKEPADPFLVQLANDVKKFKLVERDPTEPHLDAHDSPISGDASNIEGYRSQFL